MCNCKGLGMRGHYCGSGKSKIEIYKEKLEQKRKEFKQFLENKKKRK